MAGHNKWSKVKRLKAVTDRRKGAAFSKILNEIMIAAKNGPDPAANSRLRKAISDAKAQSVPRDNIERAVKKGSGQLGEGIQLDDLVYEAFGPNGVGFMIECVSDNRNRTQPELKKILERGGGAMAEMGSVAWGFERKGIVLVEKQSAQEERLMNLVLEIGADDLKTSDDGYEILSSPQNFDSIRTALEKENIPIEFSEITYVPTNRIAVASESIEIIEKLMEALEEQSDVQKVVHNGDF